MSRRGRIWWAGALSWMAAACTGTTPAATGSGVLQHHNHASRDGVFVEPLFTKTAVTSLHLDPTFAATYTGLVWAQPLYLDGVRGGPDLLFVATETNEVIALDASTGSRVWARTLASQAIRPTTACSPGPVGITGTPVIDGGARVLYVDALTGGDAHKHLVFALDADTGATRAGWPVDVNATARFGDVAFDSSTQNQRGALALMGGTLFVPYGGFGGDCGLYHGWVVGISTSDPKHVVAWATRALCGGVWAPGGIATDGKSLYFSTGNTAQTGSTWQDGEAVFKLPPSLTATGKTTDYFAPANWEALDTADFDLGGTAPVLFDVPGATPSTLLMVFGKDANGYLLDRNDLGGVGQPLVLGSALLWYQIISAHVAYTTPTGTYVVTRGPGYGCEDGYDSGRLVAVKVAASSPPKLTVPWCNLTADSKGAPAVSMTDADGTDAVVWIVGSDDKLHGMDGETGWPVLDGRLSTDVVPDISRHQPPIISKGRLFVAGNTRLYAFTLN